VDEIIASVTTNTGTDDENQKSKIKNILNIYLMMKIVKNQ
jgi:hypothetical protein